MLTTTKVNLECCPPERAKESKIYVILKGKNIEKMLLTVFLKIAATKIYNLTVLSIFVFLLSLLFLQLLVYFFFFKLSFCRIHKCFIVQRGLIGRMVWRMKYSRRTWTQCALWKLGENNEERKKNFNGILCGCGYQQ